MASRTNSMFTFLILFTVLFQLVVGAPSSSPSPAPVPTPIVSAPAFAPGLAPAGDPGCRCPLKIETTVACSVALVREILGRPGKARNTCCEGLTGLKEEGVYECMCDILNRNVSRKPFAVKTVPAAVKAVEIMCKL